MNKAFNAGLLPLKDGGINQTYFMEELIDAILF